MAPNVTTPVNSLSLRSVLEKEKLNGLNFLNWYRNLRIVLKNEKKFYVLEEPVPDEPPPTASKTVRDAWLKHTEESVEVACLMLATMIPDLQKNMELFGAYDMLQQLKEMFQKQARLERFETVRSFHSCKMEGNQSVSSYVLKMKGYIDHLQRLGVSIPNELATDMILNSLTKEFDHFVMNYNMNG